MIAALILVPLIAGLIAFIIKSKEKRRLLLVLSALIHLSITIAIWFEPKVEAARHWLYLDSLGLFFLTITSLLFTASAIYAVAYLKREEGKNPEALFVGCLLLFLSTMTIVTASQHFGLLWIAMEATTLVSAPLISFHRQAHSLEATWKYLLICSVGIAIALLGTLFLVVANQVKTTSFLLNHWIALGPELNQEWLKAAFILFFVGYGTKMGLAPMHTWLPDAHSEAPSLVSALLSGALLNCSFLGLLRIYQVCSAAGLGEFAKEIFLIFGILSITIASFFIIRQLDFKRMLAYSSIEHMGILALGIGIGGGAIFGSLFHSLNHSLTKSALFLISGNIMYKYKTKLIPEVYGLNQSLPLSGTLWILGFLSITGTPPFGTFLSKFIILKAMINQGHGIIAAIVLFLFTLIFIGMAQIFLSMFQKRDSHPPLMPAKESLTSLLSPIIFIIALLTLGVYPFLNDVLMKMAEALK